MAKRKVGLFLRDDTPATDIKTALAHWRGPGEAIREYLAGIDKALRVKPSRPGSAELAATARDKLADLRALLDQPEPDPLALAYAGMLLVQAFSDLHSNEVWEKPVEARRKQNASGTAANASREVKADSLAIAAFNEWRDRMAHALPPGCTRRDTLRRYFNSKARAVSERTRRRLRKLVDADD